MHTATRFIEMDVGHRVPLHGSKCRHIHGHRYKVEMTIRGDLKVDGAEQGMVQDFGFMKSILEREVHDTFDHGLALYIDDPLVKLFHRDLSGKEWLICQELIKAGKRYVMMPVVTFGEPTKLIVCEGAPTAENLAFWFYDRCQNEMEAWGRTERITKMRVWETPNCFADYMPE